MERAKREFVENVGLFCERSGLPRMAGRMLGWLLICDPPHQSQADIAAALQASKGSISSASRQLTHFGLVERIGLPGERRDFFRLRQNAWDELMQGEIDALHGMRELAEQGLAITAGAPDAIRQPLDDLHGLTLFLLDEFPALIARWRAQRDAAQHADGT